MCKELCFGELKLRVEQWAKDKGIDQPENYLAQLGKMKEEHKELVEEVENLQWSANMDAVKEEFGDLLVTQIILANQMEVDLLKALELALNKIEARKGEVIDGVFVKQSDLIK